MEQVAVVDRGERVAQLPGVGVRVLGREPAGRAQARLGEQAPAGGERHHQERAAVGLLVVVDLTDVRVAHAAGERDLLFESLHPRRVGGAVGGQELEGDRLPERLVLDLIHLAHPALAELRYDPVAVGDDIARFEPRAELRASDFDGVTADVCANRSATTAACSGKRSR